VVLLQGRGNKTGALGGPIGDSGAKKWRIYSGHMEGGPVEIWREGKRVARRDEKE
jgi:hypothetical protein